MHSRRFCILFGISKTERKIKPIVRMFSARFWGYDQATATKIGFVSADSHFKQIQISFFTFLMQNCITLIILTLQSSCKKCHSRKSVKNPFVLRGDSNFHKIQPIYQKIENDFVFALNRAVHFTHILNYIQTILCKFKLKFLHFFGATEERTYSTKFTRERKERQW